MVGLCHSNMGNFSPAFDAFERAITIDPSGREYRANLGQLLKDVGKGEEAMAAFQGAVEVDEEYAQAWHLGGLCAYGMGDTGKAKEWFNRSLEAIKRNPEKNSLKVNVPGLFHMMGVCEVGGGRYEMAMKVRIQCGVTVLSTRYSQEHNFDPLTQLPPHTRPSLAVLHDGGEVCARGGGGGQADENSAVLRVLQQGACAVPLGLT